MPQLMTGPISSRFFDSHSEIVESASAAVIDSDRRRRRSAQSMRGLLRDGSPSLRRRISNCAPSFDVARNRTGGHNLMMEEQSPPGIGARVDWRDPKSSEPLLQLDRAGWAGEFLKRNCDFVAITQLSRDRWPATASTAKRRPVSARACFAGSARVRMFEDWGALFRGALKLFDFLVARLQSLRVVRRGGANRVRSPGRFRRLAF